jgi:hypothetical protein
MARTRVYLGLAEGKREVFRASATPTRATHGTKYAAVVGPFRTVRGARFMQNHGAGNPHCVTVWQAERLGKKYAAK